MSERHRGTISRRALLALAAKGAGASAVAAGFPAIVPSSVFGATSPSNRINVGAIVTANSAAPYNYTTGRDDNLDFNTNDRPAGVRFNSLRGRPFFETDLRVTKKFFLDEVKSVEVLWEMFNVFNTENLADFNGNERASTFRQARSALPPFQGQFGLRFTF